MTRIKTLMVVGVVVGIPIVYWLVSPFFITREIREDFPMSVATTTVAEAGIDTAQEALQRTEPTIIARGMFTSLAGHSATGTALLVKVGESYAVRFEDDFRVTNGPDLFVYLGKDNAYDATARLAELKGNVGSQNYSVPETIDTSLYNEVWVWCRAFSVPFGKAIFMLL
jgi:hypothetical protein